MNNELNYRNNPLNGVGLKKLLTEIVDHYGFEILFAYLNLNCFKTNPSVASSMQFLKKTEWAREKVEAFYLYEFKNLPKVSSEQFNLPVRDRIIPDDQKPGEPAELSLEDAARLSEERAKKAAEHGKAARNQGRKKKGFSDKRAYGRSSKSGSVDSTDLSSEGVNDPWAKWRK